MGTRATYLHLKDTTWGASIRVSVVVPTYRRPELLRRCLVALFAQDFDPTAYEIIVADDAACDQTQQMVACLARHLGAPGPQLRYVRVTGNHGPAAARNAGWRAARGEIIAFTDDDCIPQSSWLRAGVAAFVNGAVGASGRVIVPLPPRPTDYERDAAGLQRSEFVTANCFYRRDALDAAGGFDERFTMAWREDSDLFFRLLKRARTNGHEPLIHVPDAVVIHPVRPAPWGVSLRQQRKSMFNALLYKKHPQLYRQRIQPLPPWRYYLIVAALIAGIAGRLSGYRRLATGGAGLWLALTVQFCAMRLHRTTYTPRHILEMIVTSVLIPPLSVFWRIRGALKFRVWFF